MNHHLIPLFSFMGIIALFFSCRSGKETPDSYARRQLIFGTGGGFTGQVEQYILLENGHLFSQNILTREFTGLGKISKKTCKKFFKEADTLGIASTSFTNPGNKYYFLEMKDSSHQNRITWGDQNTPIDPSFSKLYQHLMNTMREIE